MEKVRLAQWFQMRILKYEKVSRLINRQWVLQMNSPNPLPSTPSGSNDKQNAWKLTFSRVKPVHKNLVKLKTCEIFLCYRGLVWTVCWIYNYLCNWCPSSLKLWVRILVMVRCTTLCDKVCQWLPTGWWFSPNTLVSSIN